MPRWPATRGIVCEAHRLVYYSTLGLGVIKKKKKRGRPVTRPRGFRVRGLGFRDPVCEFWVSGVGVRVSFPEPLSHKKRVLTVEFRV